MKPKKTGFIAWAMRYHNITTILVGLFVIIGVIALIKMPRNEYPKFTIRQGLVVGVYPGATSSEVEEQLTKQVENYIFGYKEVKKAKTYSESKEGMMIVYVELNDDVTDADAFWSKLKHGLAEFKSTLPSGVLALVANSDFGDTSALLITLSSDTKGYKDMEEQLKKLKAECRKIPSVSKIKDYGLQREKIEVNVEPEKLNEYNIKSISLLSSYMSNGVVAPAGKLKTPTHNLYVHFPPNFESEKDLANQIVFSDPGGGVVRLKDIAKIERKDQDPDSYITQNGKKTILLSLEMQSGNNIVEFGKQVQAAMKTFKKQCPSDIEVNVISNLPEYVNESITDFMREFLIAIVAVVMVVMLLLPRKVATIAGLTVPIAVLITLAAMYFLKVELNTVSLAGLIIVLGMIVDNSIVVIDNYVEKKDHGLSSWHAAIKSARELVMPIITATLAICVVYIPLGILLPGTSGDFVHDLPVTICIALSVSVVVALFVVPFLNFYFIKKGLKDLAGDPDKKTFLDKMQGVFDAILEKALRHPRTTLGLGVVSVILAVFLFKFIDQRLFPELERNQFAVEIYLEEGASLQNTAGVVNSVATMLQQDKRVSTVTSFIGTSSPRFHTAYAPQMPMPNYGQLLINTINDKATRELCEEYDKKLSNAYPNAHIKWKILALQTNKYPIEIRVSGDSIRDLRKVQAQIDSLLKPVHGIAWLRNDWEHQQQNIRINMDQDKASRLGYSKSWVATSLMVGLDGLPLTTIWEGDYPVSVELKQDKPGQSKDVKYLGDQTITSPMSFSNTALRSLATFSPEWTEGVIVHRNGTRTLTVQVDLASDVMASSVLNQIRPAIEKLSLPEGVSIDYGGEVEGQVESFVPMTYALMISIVIIFFILLFQFKKVKLASLIMSTMLLGLPGAAIGLFVMRYPFSLTGFIGITSLCGIVVRNGIILIDYLQELRVLHGMTVKEAALAASKRRMRPIFLTSAAASVGVIPMILSRSPLWGPLGTVICFGLLISMVLTLFVLPALYLLINKDKGVKRKVKHQPYTNIQAGWIVVLVMAASSFTLHLQAQSSRRLDLDSCKILSVRNNLKIKDADFELKSSNEVRKEAFTKYFPKVSGTALAMHTTDYLIKGKIPEMNLPVYDGNPANLATASQYAYFPGMPLNLMNSMSMASVMVVQPVFMGGKIVHGNKLARLGVEVTQQKKQLTTTQVMMKTEELFWNTVSLQEKLKTICAYEVLLQQLHQDVATAVKAGLAQRSDLLKVELKQNELDVNKLKLRNGIALSYKVFCQHLGIAYDSTTTLKFASLSEELPKKIAPDDKPAITNRVEYQLMDKSVKAQQLQKKMIVGDYLPQVALAGVAYTSRFAGMNTSNALGMVTVNVPISDWWEGKHKIDDANIRIDQAREKLTETAQLLELEVEQAKNEMNETYYQIGKALSSVAQSKENLKVVHDNYKSGISSMSDLLEAQALYEDAQNQHTEAVCSYKIKEANYRRTIGNYK